MKGSISTTSILEVLQMLSLGGREGVLQIRRKEDILSVNEEAKIYIKNGKVCFISIEGAKTLIDAAKQRLGADLNVKEEEQVLKMMYDERILDIVEDIIRDRLLIVATWKEGEYEFVDKTVDLPEIYPISSLIISVVSALDETAEAIDISPFSIPVIEPKGRVEEKLSSEEWKVLCWINGERNVLEISELSSLSFSKTVLGIRGLLNKGIITLKEPINIPDKESLKREVLDLYRSGRYSEVIQKIDRLISIMPEDRDLILIKAESLYKLERYDEVVKVLSQLVEREDDPNLKRFFGYALVGAGRFKEALRVLESVGEGVLSEILRMLMNALKEREELI